MAKNVNPNVQIFILLLIGIFLFFGGLYSFSDTLQFLHSAQKTQGQIYDWEVRRSTSNNTQNSYYPKVRFQTPDGKNIEFVSSSGDSAMLHYTHAVDVFFDPANPYNARIDSFSGLWLWPTLLLFMSVLFTGIPVGVSFYKRARQKKIDLLKKKGIKVQMKVDRVDQNPNLKINNQSPWVIVCSPPEGSPVKRSTFKSGNLWSDPAPFLQNGFVDVWVDPTDYQNYWVDTSFISS